MAERRHPKSLFWKIADELIEEGKASEGTMMGHPCLRTLPRRGTKSKKAQGDFFATLMRDREELVVKLPRERVEHLVREEIGEPFAPAGRVFREWVAIPKASTRRWRKLVDEALAFVSGA